MPETEPRTWREGDPEPGSDVRAVQNQHGILFIRRPWPVAYGRRNAITVWQNGPMGDPHSWEALLAEDNTLVEHLLPVGENCWTALRKINNQGNPSNPETRQTPSPVSYVEGGEKIAPRASQGVETCPSCGALGYGNATCRTCHAKWVEAWGHQCVFVSAGPGTDRARADAAEAKLAEAVEHRDAAQQKIGELRVHLKHAQAERGEARAKLAEIAAALAVADNDKAVPYEYLTDTVRAVLRDGPPPAEPLTDREEPAQAPEISGAGVPFEQSTGPKRDQCGASSPNGRKQCIRHRGHAGEHMSSVIDTQWASEEPAGETKPERVEWNPTGDTWLPATVIQYRDTPHYLIQLDDGHERLLVEIRHTRPVERQAGNSETKPRERLFGFELPEYIGWTEMNGIYQASCVWDPEKVKFSPLFNEDSTSHLAKFLNLHRHGQPAERQADSETQR